METANSEKKSLFKAVNKLLTIGNLIHAIPADKRLSQFLFTALSSIDGVRACRVCLFSANEPYGNLKDQGCEECLFFYNSGQCLKQETKVENEIVFSLSTFTANYAYLIIHTSPGFRHEIIPAIKNLANIAAVSIENNQQRKILQKNNIELENYRRFLEEKIRERTNELEQTNKELTKVIQIFNEAQAVANIGHWELDLLTNELYWSDEVYKIFGIDVKDFKASYEGFLDQVHDDDKAIVKRKFDEAMEYHYSYDIEHRLQPKATGVKYVQEKGRVEFNEEGIPVRAVGMVLDITSKKENELLIIENEKKLKRQNLEYEILNEELKIKNHEYEMLVEKLSEAYKKINLINTDLVKAKNRAEESDRLKTAFLHNISHEIRTPMNAIVGFSELLNDSYLDAEQRLKFTDIIVKSSKQLLSIIDDIVNIASIESGHEKINPKRTNINSILRLVHQQYYEQALNNSIEFYYSPGLKDEEAEVITDETKLIQVISNLIGNALKFTDVGFVKFGYENRNEFLEFYVSDTGIGIPAAMHEEIFERFRQAENRFTKIFGGSGLGLSISKGYIELLGGKIWLESEVGAGSTFYFSIPKSTKILKEEVCFQNFEDSRCDNTRNKTILIVEDEETNYILMHEMLKTKELKTVRAKNGMEAIEMCFSNFNIDLVLMDINMPVLDGYEAARKIQEFRPGIKIIAQTAFWQDADKQKAFDSGFIDYLSKPISIKELLRVTEKYL